MPYSESAIPALNKHSAGNSVPYSESKSDYLAPVGHASVVDPSPLEGGPDVVDRICRLRNFEEMTFNAELSQDAVVSPVRCIVDNGCGLGYLLVPVGLHTPFVTFPCKSRAVLAQGDIVDIISAVNCRLTISGTTRDVTLRVMSTTTDDELSILFGRYLLELFNIETKGARLVKLGREILFKRDEIRRVKVSCVDSDDCPDVDVDGIVNLPKATTPSDSVVLPLESFHEKEVDRLLSHLEGAGSQPLLHCPGSVNLRRLRSTDVCDTPDQTHSFEIELRKPNREPVKPHLYAASMIKKLNPKQQDQVAEVVEGYVTAGWWSKLPDDHSSSSIPVSNVFAVPKGNDVRLVCDMREVNKMYPSTVSDQPQIPFSLALLRLRKGSLVVGDCRSAFYRVRLSQPIPLYVGQLGLYQCHRMCFGLSYGPEGLAASLGVIFNLFQLIWNVVGSLYVDDFWMNPPDDSPLLALFLRLLSRCGFDVSESKFQCLTPGNRTLSLFGINLNFLNGLSCVDCNRSELLSDPLRVLTDPVTRCCLSKKDVFALAGKLGYDPIRGHCEGKVIADLLRSIAGSVVSDWNTPIDQSSLPDKLLFESVLDWAVELIQREVSEPCQHSIPLPTAPVSFRLSCDACNSGGAFCVEVLGSDNVWRSLLTEAWGWRRQENSYHSNRLEAIALFRAMRSFVQFVEFIVKSAPGEEKPIVEILTDSKSALAWATIGPSASVAGGYEGRAVLRLSKALVGELSYLRGLLCEKVSISHVSGAQNIADSFSRLLERPASRCPSLTISQLIQKRNERVTKEKSAKRSASILIRDADMVRRFQSLEPGVELAEIIASQSYDIHQAVWYVKVLRHLLKSWRYQSEGRARLRFPSPNLLPSFEMENLQIFCRSAQTSVQSARWEPPFSVCPLGCIEHVRVEFNGETVRTFYIPKCSTAVVDLIVRSAHRASYHRGVNHTCSLIGTPEFPFFVEGCKSAVTRCIKNCFRCAVKNQVAPVIGSFGETFPREMNLPTFSRISCDVLFIDNRKALSVMCIDTGFLALLLIDSPKIIDCISGLKRLTNRFGVSIKYIRADRGFKSLNLPNVEVSLTAPDTPYTNPVERLHAEARCIIRSEKFIRRCFIDGSSDLAAQDCLDKIAAVCNSRPLGRYVEGSKESLITPALLAFGTKASTELYQLREYFYKRIFASMRRVFSKSKSGPHFLVGQRALYFDDSVTKSDSKFQLCRIVDIRPPYFSILLIGTDDVKKEKIVGRGSLVPLNLPFLNPSSPMDVSRVGARISSVFNFGGKDTVFFGTVVRDVGNEIEVKWDDVRWRNELIDWGACRIVSQ